MDFKRYQFLKNQALMRLQDVSEPIELNDDEAKTLDSLTLAYIGDAVYSVYVRERVISSGINKVRILHDLVTMIICAKTQSEAYHYLESKLNETELFVGRRARNSHVTVPKSATVQEYRSSTALEAIMGYLHLTKKNERLREICEIVFDYSVKQIKR